MAFFIPRRLRLDSSRVTAPGLNDVHQPDFLLPVALDPDSERLDFEVVHIGHVPGNIGFAGRTDAAEAAGKIDGSANVVVVDGNLTGESEADSRANAFRCPVGKLRTTDKVPPSDR